MSIGPILPRRGMQGVVRALHSTDNDRVGCNRYAGAPLPEREPRDGRPFLILQELSHGERRIRMLDDPAGAELIARHFDLDCGTEIDPSGGHLPRERWLPEWHEEIITKWERQVAREEALAPQAANPDVHRSTLTHFRRSLDQAKARRENFLAGLHPVTGLTLATL